MTGTAAGNDADLAENPLTSEYTVKVSTTIDPFLMGVPRLRIDEDGYTVRQLSWPEFVRIDGPAIRRQPVLRVVPPDEGADATRNVTISSTWISPGHELTSKTARLDKASEREFRRFRFRNRPEFWSEVAVVVFSTVAAVVGALAALGRVVQWPEPVDVGWLVALHAVGILAALGAAAAALRKSYYAPLVRR